jgi:hypothetical protein
MRFRVTESDIQLSKSIVEVPKAGVNSILGASLRSPWIAGATGGDKT